jgi:hypothetical protein
MLAKAHKGIASACNRAQLHSRLTNRIIQAFQQFSKSVVAETKRDDDTNRALGKARKSRDIRMVLEEKERRRRPYVCQMRQDARKVLIAMNTLPDEEPWAMTRKFLQAMMNKKGAYLPPGYPTLRY